MTLREPMHGNLGHRGIVVALLVAVFLMLQVGGCENCSCPEQTEFSITGYVRLTGSIRNQWGTVLRDTTVHDPSGVAVYLATEGVVVDAAVTVGGQYRFQGLLPGTYYVVASVGPIAAFELPAPVEVVDRDIAIRDTLELHPAIGLSASPNPFSRFLGEAALTYWIDMPTYVTITIHDLRNRRVRTIVAQEGRNGPNVDVWSGQDDYGEFVPPGAYWVILRGREVNRWDLIFAE